LLVVTALDPALGGGGRMTGDYSALVTVGQQAGRIYVLEAELAHHSPRETLEAAVRNFQRWAVSNAECGFRNAELNSALRTPQSALGTQSTIGIPHFLCLAIETNTFQVVLKDMLEEMSRKEGFFIPIRPVKNFSDKVARVGSLSPLIESGNILFRKGQKLLIDQLI
ncbi:MAG: hypothetical protein ACK4WF_10230, partial [Candidatus Brocadiales bacterium]